MSDKEFYDASDVTWDSVTGAHVESIQWRKVTVRRWPVLRLWFCEVIMRRHWLRVIDAENPFTTRCVWCGLVNIATIDLLGDA